MLQSKSLNLKVWFTLTKKFHIPVKEIVQCIIEFLLLLSLTIFGVAA